MNTGDKTMKRKSLSLLRLGIIGGAGILCLLIVAGAYFYAFPLKTPLGFEPYAPTFLPNGLAIQGEWTLGVTYTHHWYWPRFLPNVIPSGVGLSADIGPHQNGTINEVNVAVVTGIGLYCPPADQNATIAQNMLLAGYSCIAGKTVSGQTYEAEIEGAHNYRIRFIKNKTFIVVALKNIAKTLSKKEIDQFVNSFESLHRSLRVQRGEPQAHP